MAIAVSPEPKVSTRRCLPIGDRHGWGFALLLTTTATLFLRPADLIPALEHWPIYQCLIVAALAFSAPSIARQLSNKRLSEQPVTACLLLLLLAVGVSHLAHGFLWGARMSMYEFGKLLALYLLIVGLVNTPRRLTGFVQWLTLSITMIAAIALLDRVAIISIPALESIRDHGASDAGKAVLVERIRGTGIFQDPNDFGLILVVGLVFCASFLFRRAAGWPRYLWLIPGSVLLTTLTMTHSRGALLALTCAVPAALAYYRSWKLGALSLLGLPMMAVVFSNRMTDVNAVIEGTGQSRIQIWSASLTVLREYPLFGLGEGLLVDELGVVAHNSFLHCYAELGVLGGTAFLSCFLAAALGLWSSRGDGQRLNQVGRAARDIRDLTHLRVFVFAALAAYSAGMLTISRQFVMPTYLILGLATATQSLRPDDTARWQIGNRFLSIMLLASVGLLLTIYLSVRVLARW